MNHADLDFCARSKCKSLEWVDDNVAKMVYKLCMIRLMTKTKVLFYV